MHSPDESLAAIPFDHSYARLPEQCFSRVAPTPVQTPALIRVNVGLAEELGLDPELLESASGVAMLAGNAVVEGSDPLAMAYAGHQFGGWVPQLGDGRAILLGELLDNVGQRHDIQLKGAGRTPYSRGGDGRAWLGPVLREYVVSEAMAALGIATTRALAAVATGESVLREAGPLPGAVLTRVASSHIRVGTFQFFAARQDFNALRALTQHVIERHYPTAADAASPALAMLDAVMERQIQLVARWQGVGFIHGVMNTDNTSVAGITIDYGPCAFLDAFDPDKVFSAIDRMGRYAYARQPGILQWNLANLAQCLLPLINDDEAVALEQAQALINDYPRRYQAAWLRVMRNKTGLSEDGALRAHAGTGDETITADAEDTVLIEDLLSIMHRQQADFTETFRRLSHLGRQSMQGSADDADNTNGGEATDPVDEARLLELFDRTDDLATWLVRWRRRVQSEAADDQQRQAAMQAVNPAVIPRNHRIEAAITAAAEQQDFAPFHELVEVLREPYRDRDEYAAYRDPPSTAEEVRQTFCGT